MRYKGQIDDEEFNQVKSNLLEEKIKIEKELKESSDRIAN